MEIRILLVDDEMSVLKALKRLFERSGYQVDTAISGQEALNQMELNTFPVIITDFRMPEMSGAELLRIIRKRWPWTVCMVLSGYTDFNSVVELLNQGLAYRFLEKPWDEADLLQQTQLAFQRHNEQLHQKQRDQLLLGSQAALVEIDLDGTISRLNGAASAMAPDLNAVGQPLLEQIHAVNKEDFAHFLQCEVDDLLVWDCNGQSLLLERYLFDGFCHIIQLSVEIDVRPEQLLPETLDLSTEQQISVRLDACLSSQQRCSLVTFGINQYDIYTELLGFREAEKLVQSLSKAMLKTLESGEKLCYLNADRFVVLLPHCGSDQAVLERLEVISVAIQSFLTEKSGLGTLRLYGVYAVVPDDGLSFKELFGQMRLCMMHQAKCAFQAFSRLDSELIKDYRLHFAVSRALLQPELVQQLKLTFQPKLNSDGHLAGAEVLLRWFEPKKYGWISPAVFIPIAERDGQIIDIGRWVIAQTCKQLSDWKKQGVRLCTLAINLSGRQLKEDVGLIGYIQQQLNDFQIQPEMIAFELTETYLVQDLQHCQRQLQQLQNLGFKIYIDDFGCGYSSLSYLSRLSADAVKLDKSLIDDLETSLAVQSMVRNIIRMSHELGLDVVAEGVETAFQVDILKRMGCGQMQGFFFAQPLKANEYLHYLKQLSSGSNI